VSSVVGRERLAESLFEDKTRMHGPVTSVSKPYTNANTYVSGNRKSVFVRIHMCVSNVSLARRLGR
jgi:hypothetical protein